MIRWAARAVFALAFWVAFTINVWTSPGPWVRRVHAEIIPRKTCERLCGIQGCISARPETECANHTDGSER